MTQATETRKEIPMKLLTANSLVLPWPDSKLSPNSRTPHRWLTGARNIARNTGYFAAKEVGLHVPDRTPLHLHLTFLPPDHRRRDVDNLLSASKSSIDGIFEALGVDDSNIRLTTLGIGKRVEGGAVIVRIEVIKSERTITK